MGYVITPSTPGTKAAKAILDTWPQARRHSRHIFEQLAQTERAMLKLWRLGSRRNAQ